MSNYYEDLGLSRQASQEEIKKAYRKLARKYHPDVSKETDAEAKMQTINVAYDTLSNPEKKKEYDFSLDHPNGFAGFQGQGGHAGQGHYYQQSSGNGQQDFSGFEDLFGRFGQGFGGGQQEFYRGRQSQTAYRGEDQHASIEVPIDVAYHGTTQTLSLQVPSYTATGQAEVQRKTIQVKIPAGLKQGQQIRLAKQGQAGINGGEAGDLYIEVQYAKTAHSWVEGNDVYLKVNVTPWEVALAENITVQTPAGKVQVSIPAKAQNGQQLRLKGKGIPSKTAGQLYLILNIVIPTAYTEAEREAYQQLAKTFNNFNPRNA
ncbi:DnaJ C-terminal domain-containing protein [Acinetobacter larvae]|uniref:DNA-binding protein n=1 Tax=Acinetobacter larvae TaxID=1789224 RepID=A0A1B2LWN9_9GAMM|nr:DnaJ C-terminal domain-containing protein [Acinetobacter larvae]AOA57183.1 DNA-binding protein [Acinetobacter larvae]